LSNSAYRRAPAGGTVLWRGPSWIGTNWYIARGLRRHGRPDLAARIEDASLQLVERSGFREHYDAESGEGYGARGFAWSALVLDLAEERLSP
jgi:glycogen debranching enzyme